MSLTRVPNVPSRVHRCKLDGRSWLLFAFVVQGEIGMAMCMRVIGPKSMICSSGAGFYRYLYMWDAIHSSSESLSLSG